MNKYISKTLIVVGIFTLFLIASNSLFAAYPTIQDCANSTWTTPIGCDKIMDSYYAGYYSNGYDYVTTTHNNNYYNNQQVAYANYQPTPIPVVNNYYYKDESVKTSSTVSSTTKSTTQASTKTKTNASDSNVKSDSSTADSEDVFSTDSNGLTALSFRGSGGFLPSSFWQWLLVIFLILIIVIIARLIARSHKENDHTAPAH